MKKFVTFLLINLILVFIFTGCETSNYPVQTEPVSGNGFVPAKAGNYDSADTAVVLAINTAECKITFKTTFIGKKYTLYYDGATVFADKYGTGMSVKQLKAGDLVDINFLKAWKRLDSLKLSEKQFSFNNIKDYQFSFDGKHVMIAGQQYTLNDNLAVTSSEGTLTLMDINPVDELTFIGFDHNVYSIIIERSHGYLRLINESYFVGGWLEVNQNLIRQIEEDIIIAVPVGTYPVCVSNYGSSGKETVSIEQGKEYELDVSKWQAEEKFGDVIFTVDPDDARVYIDGNVTDITEPVNLSYGIHQMIVIADGHQTISKYLKVGSESANIDIIMEPKDKNDVSTSDNTVASTSENVIGPPVSSNETVSYNIINPPASASKNDVTYNETENATSASANSTNTVSTTNTNKVYIDGPSGAEVYVDGGYIGLAPVAFPKKEGTVVIILRKSGYETRSYTINLDSEKKDVNYSFSELQKIN